MAQPGWRMLINQDGLGELYITAWDGQCWDINRNPITSGAKSRDHMARTTSESRWRRKIPLQSDCRQ
jgi:hypothetical protein